MRALPQQLQQQLRSTTRSVIFLGLTGGIASTGLLHMELADESRRRLVWDAYYRSWARKLFSTFGIDLRVAFDDENTRLQFAKGPGDGVPTLVVANHRSPLDIPILVRLFGGRIMSQSEVARWPVIGFAATASGCIFVDREDGHSGANAIRKVRQQLRDGETVMLFPEGGVRPGDEIVEFKRGAFVAAKGIENMRIVPVGIAYPPECEWLEGGFREHLLNVAKRKHTTVAVNVGNPYTGGGRSEDEAERARLAVQALVTRARQEVNRGAQYL